MFYFKGDFNDLLKKGFLTNLFKEYYFYPNLDRNSYLIVNSNRTIEFSGINLDDYLGGLYVKN